jgi:3-deoxy-D-manno-octulosonic-acid transferase
VVLAASTREGEEAQLLDAWLARGNGRPDPKVHDPRMRAEQKTRPDPILHDPILLIVPRHPQRFDEVARLVEQRGLTLARRSAWAHAANDGVDAVWPAAAGAAQVWLGDSIGEMALYFSLADVALLGGSFASFGGQNLIEAAASGCPLVMGPHTFNFSQAAKLALEAGAAWRVPEMAAGVQQALALAALPVSEHQALRHRALGFAQAHRGAAQRMAQAVLARIPSALVAKAAATAPPSAAT